MATLDTWRISHQNLRHEAQVPMENRSSLSTLFLLVLTCASSMAAETDRSNKTLNASCHKDDLKALLDLKATITLSSGREGEQCCSWPTLKCNNETIALEITDPYDAGDSIGYESATGTISFSLGILSSLESLALSSLGEIPASIGKILTLKRLFLNGNNLTGAIPVTFGALSNLTELHLEGNKFSEAISSLQNLRELRLESNQLAGSISFSFGGLHSLRQLDISSNRLTGSIPGSIVHLNPERFKLAHNKIAGPVPSDLGRLSSLEVLDLSDNQLTGSLPSSLGSCKSLRNLWLSENELSGTIPVSWGSSSLVNFSVIDLSSNQLTGEVPSSLGSLRSLAEFSVAHNKLSGSSPDLSMTLSSLDLSYNQFHLQIVPGWLSKLSANYFRLSLASCGIEELPSFLSQLNLGLLDLSMNTIKVRQLPALSSSFSGLYHLNLSFNPLAVPLSSDISKYSIDSIFAQRGCPAR